MMPVYQSVRQKPINSNQPNENPLNVVFRNSLKHLLLYFCFVHQIIRYIAPRPFVVVQWRRRVRWYLSCIIFILFDRDVWIWSHSHWQWLSIVTASSLYWFAIEGGIKVYSRLTAAERHRIFMWTIIYIWTYLV